MGTNMTPAYAKNTMNTIKTSFPSASPLKHSFYYRYIYRIFLVWPNDNDSLTHFLKHDSNIHHVIKFAHECSKNTLTFLDVPVQIRLS